MTNTTHTLILGSIAVFALITGAAMVEVHAGLPGIIAGLALVAAGLTTAYAALQVSRS